MRGENLFNIKQPKPRMCKSWAAAYGSCRSQADRVRTRCLAANSVLQVTEDHERHRVTLWIAPIDHAGILAEATRSVRPVRSDRAQGAGLLSPVWPSPPPSICQLRQG